MDGAISSFAKFIDVRLRSNLRGRVPGRVKNMERGSSFR